METMKYTIIKDIVQYEQYCSILEKLIECDGDEIKDEIDLLTLLIEKWDNEHSTFSDSDPVEILKAVLEGHNLKAKDLADILDLSKGTVSKILNYQKGLSKDTIRKLAEYFKISQEAFNRPYKMLNELNLNMVSKIITRKNRVEV